MQILLMIASVLALGLPQGRPVEVTTDEEFLRTVVEKGCRGNHPSTKMAAELLRIEKAAGIGGAGRGILLAAACNESGFHSDSKGDWYKIGLPRVRANRCYGAKKGCLPTSYGLLQFKGWAKKGIRRMGSKFYEPRFDWRKSAEFWSRHVVGQVGWVRRVCGYTKDADVWRAAHKTALRRKKCARYRFRDGEQKCVKYEPRCHRVGSRNRQSHWRILNGWNNVTGVDLAVQGYPRAVNP